MEHLWSNTGGKTEVLGEKSALVVTTKLTWTGILLFSPCTVSVLLCPGRRGLLLCLLYTTHNTTQHNTTQHNTPYHTTTQHNTTQHNTTHHTTPHTTQHNTTHHTTQHNTTQHIHAHGGIFLYSPVLHPCLFLCLDCPALCLLLTTYDTNIHAPGGIRTRNPSKRSGRRPSP